MPIKKLSCLRQTPRCFISLNLLLSHTRSLKVTGSALALHCCKAHAKINWKIENSTRCKIVTHEDFNLKLGTRDYVADITHLATSEWAQWGLRPNRENITLL